MNNYKLIHALLGATLSFGLAACGDDGGDPTSDPTMATTDPPPTTDPSTTDADPTTTSDPPPTTDPDPTTGDPLPDFNFSEEEFDNYIQIDRHGAVEAGTAGIRASGGLGLMGEDISIRDDYNASNPAEDAMNMWLGEIADSITFFHDALDDDIMGLGLTPATFDQTVAQAGPVIIPDAIKYDPKMPTGYPNGRTLTDPVVDITLAAVLLSLDDHPLTLFVDLPLNPPENDVPFKAEFPFLAPPHAP